MATANEIFSKAYDDDPHFVINSDRSITVPKELLGLSVQFDHNIETVTFDCPRYCDEYDLSTLNLYVNYIRADRVIGVHICSNITVDPADDQLITFDWRILQNVTLVAGPIKFLICAQNILPDGTVEQLWHTRVCDKCEIVPGIECPNDRDPDELFFPDNQDYDRFLAKLVEFVDTYDKNQNGIVDNAEAVNGVKFGADEFGIYADVVPTV